MTTHRVVVGLDEQVFMKIEVSFSVFSDLFQLAGSGLSYL
jgi:hypothetical protein